MAAVSEATAYETNRRVGASRGGRGFGLLSLGISAAFRSHRRGG